LDKKHYDRQHYEGKLPASAPLANPYVPFQRENPPKYEPRKGLVRGTLFPGLDLPFMGKVNKNELAETPLSELQVLGFAMHDLALYLDTHRDDKEALALYRQYQKVYHDAMMEYSKQCTPLTHTCPVSDEAYTWLDDPWPWEYCKN
jgi:spore coat protein JB